MKSEKTARERLDVLVVARGLAPTRERAQALIMAGIVCVDGQEASKQGAKYPIDAPITVREQSPELRYVSRGGLKLEHALDIFQLDPSGMIAVDIGASTGGFTDVLLQRGAQRVYAVDVGYGHLAWTLREDQRVVNMERTNIRKLAALPEGVLAQCAVVDVSFISLHLVLPHVIRLLTADAWIAALVKPQFEAGKREVDRGKGVITDLAVHRRILHELLEFLNATLPAVYPCGLTLSPITGREGNHEYIVLLRQQTPCASNTSIDVDAVVSSIQK